MYIPAPFEEKRTEVLHDFMRDNSFAILISPPAGSGESMTATRIPMLLDPSRGPFGTLRGHVAKNNPQWKSFTGDTETLAIFHGPHAYISPTWYTVKLSVPTWVYATVHACGPPKIISDAGVFRTLLADTVNFYEAALPSPCSMDTLPEDFTAKLQTQIVGFEIEITRLEGKFKLNQQRNAVDRQLNIDSLQQTGDPMNIAVAGMMAERLPQRSDSETF